jgi:chromosome partitioning protein
MKKILIVNPKGGSGKTTIATNLASYYALWEIPTALIDYDPQLSSTEWLEQRPARFPPIKSVNASRGQYRYPKDIQRAIIDSPARPSRAQLIKLFHLADVVLVPVLPSPIDIRAAGHFFGELLLDSMLKDIRIGLIANRVKTNTVIFRNLEQFLKKLKVPLVSRLRDSQNYIRSADEGIGIFEMPPSLSQSDVEQWRSVINWIEKG